MTVQEIRALLIEQTGAHRETTCDLVIAGDENREVKKVATCFKATIEVIKKAHASGADLLICHEPVFYEETTPKDTPDPIAAAKWKLLDETGLAVLRYHDHAHEMTPDYIHEGMIRALGLDVSDRGKYERTQLGVRKYDLDTPLTVSELAKRAKQVLRLPCVRLVGNTDTVVKSLFLALGGTFGAYHFRLLFEQDAQLFVTGEVNEVCGCEYIRDAAALGHEKAVMVLGHYGSEYAGMRYLAEDLNSRLLPAEYIDCGEVFTAI